MDFNINKCNLCPRNCNVNRESAVGFCQMGNMLKISKAMLHKWEEPVICGGNGSGAIFFTGCNLKCCFCQNSDISFENIGKEIEITELADIFLKLQEKGASNIDLITATPFIPQIIKALDMVKHKINIPIVYNSGGYEKVETIKMLDGYIDIYLPDLKFFDSEISKKYANALDYYENAILAIKEMYNQVGKNKFNGDNLIKGVIIRHLILPMCYKDSIIIMEKIAENFDVNEILVSIMSQYTPQKTSKYKELNRRIFTMEYEKVINKAMELGIKGFMQERSSADKIFTPNFLEDIIL